MAQFIKKVTASLDDGYFAGSWSNNSSSSGIGRAFAGNEVYSAWRFQNVTIPQGVTITSAYLRITDDQNQSAKTIHFKIKGIKEANTANFSSDPDGRTKTTAGVDWDFNSATQVTGTQRTSPDIASVIQEIINQGSWASGNALGLITDDDGTSNDNIFRYTSYDGSTTICAELEINYIAGSSSVSPSVSPSISPSASVSPSASKSPSSSVSPSESRSPSPSPPNTAFVVDVSKPGIDVLHTNSPEDVKFSSRYGTLKYFTKSQQIMTIDGAAGDFAGKKIFTHNLGYHPYVEVYVRVYIGSPFGDYQYCPFAGAGATILYSANYLIKENTIELYGEFNGISASTWTFDFLLFLYKNNLQL